MKRYLPAAMALALIVIVFCTAAFRSHLTPRPTALPPTPRGVVLILVAHWMFPDMTVEKSSPHIAAILERGPAGLIPTRSGATTEDDLPAATQMLFAGARPPVKTAQTLPAVVPGVWKKAPMNGEEILSAASSVPVGSVVFATGDVTESPAALDTTIGRLTATGTGLPDGWSLVVVGATPTPQAIARRERVAPVLIWQRRSAYPGPVLLTSPSVRNRPGFAAATDVAATVAALLDLPIDRQRIGDGRAMETVPLPARAEGGTVQYLWQQAATAGLQAREQHLLPALPWCLAALLTVSVFAPWQPLQRATRAAALFAPLAIIVVAPLTASAFLGDWFVYVLAAIPTMAIALIAAGNARWEDRLPRVLAAATALTIITDTLQGGPLLSRTPFSYSILEAARFYGIGNEVSGVLLGAAIVAIGADTGTLSSALFGIALATVSAAPSLGADAGGFIATLIAFATLLIALRSSRTSPGQTVRIAALAGAGILLATCAFALWDAGRESAQRSHIGEAIAAAQARGMTAITDIVTRKLAVNIRLLFTSPWAALFATEMGLLIWLSRQKRRQTEQSSAPSAAVKAALFAAIIALFALNDSGVVAAATCGLWMFALSSDSPP